ncbi:hypothetical protein JXQ31_18845 [candidate division KSB1 bacterium]|nr:hypothetical protein [candidate division KSB1 bacterium]
MNKDDLEIQDYLDNNLSGEKREQFIKRLKSDPNLRIRFKAYKRIYNGLKSESGFTLSPKFTSRVLKKTHIESLGSVHFELWHIFIVLFVIIIGINVTFYYVDMTALVNDMKFSPDIDLNLPQGILNKIAAFFSSLNFNFALPALAVIILVVLGLLDHFVLSGRHKTASSYR